MISKISSSDRATDRRSRRGEGADEIHQITLPDRPAPSAIETAVTVACPRCKDIGFYVKALPLGHPDFGKAIPCDCRAQERTDRQLGRLIRMSNLDGMRSLTFDRFDPEPAHLPLEHRHSLRYAYETCMHFAQQPEGWLLITGTYGCGKTHLAAAIANQQLAAGKSALFQVVPDLMDHLRNSFSPSNELTFDELFEQVRSIPLLILDDFGAQHASSWVQEKLFQLLNHRYNLKLPTVVTTNLRLDEIEPRLRSRLSFVQFVNSVLITAPDYRVDSDAATANGLSTLRLHEDKRFDSFNLQRAELTAQERASIKKIYEVCLRFAQDPKGWIVLNGTYGAGKTHLAAAIANYRLDNGLGDAVFIVAPDLLDHLRAAYSPNAQTTYDRRFDEIRNTPMLVLDDLGMESATPWAREKLFQLLDYRYSASLPTVITTTSQLDDLEPWLYTRIKDLTRCQICIIQSPGYRGSPSQQQATGRGRRAR